MSELLLLSHLSAALLALPLGGYQLFRRTKGDGRHRLVGRVWVGLMLWVSLSSFGLRELNHGALSLLHVLSVVTLVSLALAIWHIRRGNVPGHRGAMTGSWLGLLGAFVGAVAVPERALPTFAVGHPLGALAAVATVAVVSWLVVAAGGLLSDQGPRRPARTVT